jgi:hypothetical protein
VIDQCAGAVEGVFAGIEGVFAGRHDGPPSLSRLWVPETLHTSRHLLILVE